MRQPDGGPVPTGVYEEYTLLEGHLVENDMVQYLPDATVDILEKGVKKIIDWQGNAPLLWRGVDGVTSWWFKIGSEGYTVFSRVARVVGIVGGAI